MNHFSLPSKQFVLLVTTLMIAFFCLVAAPAVFAQNPPAGMPSGVTELDGYAWSSNAGWISLNCNTGGTSGGNICGTANYRVQISSEGAITGYAWSSNIGWIRFGGLSSFPSGNGTVAVNARAVGTFPALTFEGWARACAGTTSAANTCNTMTARSDGWDGWISLKGSGYSVVTNATGFNASSFAWGSDVIGWIDASNALLSFVDATLTGSNCTIPRGSNSCQTVLDWDFSPSTITLPSIYKNSPSPAGILSTALSGPRTVTVAYGTTVYLARTNVTTLASRSIIASCVGEDVFNTTTNMCEFDTTIPLEISLTSNQSIIRSGSGVTLSWVVRGVPDMSACTLAGPLVPSGYMSASTPFADSWTVPAPGLSSVSNYSVSCTYGGVTRSATVRVEVIPTVTEV